MDKKPRSWIISKSICYLKRLTMKKENISSIRYTNYGQKNKKKNFKDASQKSMKIGYSKSEECRSKKERSKLDSSLSATDIRCISPQHLMLSIKLFKGN
jgi:hypothetical protein